MASKTTPSSERRPSKEERQALLTRQAIKLMRLEDFLELTTDAIDMMTYEEIEDAYVKASLQKVRVINHRHPSELFPSVQPGSATAKLSADVDIAFKLGKEQPSHHASSHSSNLVVPERAGDTLPVEQAGSSTNPRVEASKGRPGMFSRGQRRQRLTW